MRSLLLLLALLLASPAEAWSPWTGPTTTGSDETDTIEWLDLWHVANHLSPDEGGLHERAITSSNLDPRYCATANDTFTWQPVGPGTMHTVSAVPGVNQVTFGNDHTADRSFCRRDTADDDPDVCGAGSSSCCADQVTPFFWPCQSDSSTGWDTGGDCAETVSGSGEGNYGVFWDASEEVVRAVLVSNYVGCALGSALSSNILYHFKHRIWTAEVGDRWQFIKYDGIHTTELGAKLEAQRLLDARTTENFKNNLLNGGWGEKTPASSYWTCNFGTGSACTVDSTSYNATYAGVSGGAGLFAQSGNGVRQTCGATCAGSPYLQHTTLATVFPGVYKWACSVATRVATDSYLYIDWIDQAGAKVPQAQQKSLRDTGGLWVNYDWTTAGAWTAQTRSFSGDYTRATGLIEVQKATGLTVRVTQGGNVGDILVDECALERVPAKEQILPLDWANHYLIPDGEWTLKVIGDSMATTVSYRMLNNICDYQRMPGCLATAVSRTTKFRPNLTFTNDIIADSWSFGGSPLGDWVGKKTYRCSGDVPTGDANLWKKTIDGSTHDILIVYQYLNDIYRGQKPGGTNHVNDNAANEYCWTHEATLAQAEKYIVDHGFKQAIMIGPMGWRGMVKTGAGVDACSDVTGLLNTRNCGLNQDDIHTKIMHGQLGNK